jgi:hypothetical protein
LTFAPQAPGVNSKAQTVTLTNSGSAPLLISGISFGGSNGGDFSQTNNCGSAVAANASCQISVIFAPLGGGNRNATLQIANNGEDGILAVTLSGTGEDFSLTSSPLSNTVTPGQAANYVITAAPINGFNQKIGFSCSGNPVGSTCTVSPNSITLDGTSNGTVDVAIVTNSSSAGMVRPANTSVGSMWIAMSSTLGIVGLLLVRRRRYAGMALVCLFATGLMPACGGGGGSSGGSIQTGTYNIIVTGTYSAGAATVSHNAKITLVVQ